MGESKSPALPLGDAPTVTTQLPDAGRFGAAVSAWFASNSAPRAVYRHRATVSTVKAGLGAKLCWNISEMSGLAEGRRIAGGPHKPALGWLRQDRRTDCESPHLFRLRRAPQMRATPPHRHRH